MPELPEVETMRRGILGILGQTIQTASLEPCTCRPILIAPAIKPFQRRVRGQVILAVERLGKRVLIRLSSRDVMVFEPRMTGLVLVADPPDREHLRFRLDLAGGPIPKVWYWDRRGLGSVRLFTEAELKTAFGTKLGPDALAITAEQLRSALADSRRAIKVALLDQHILAGVGNLYAAEILHRARVHPEQACEHLTKRQWLAIHAQLGEVLNAAIRHEGSTLSDGTYRNALNQSGGYQNCHLVYDREHETCRSCARGTIVRIVQAQRATFYCPRCQRK